MNKYDILNIGDTMGLFDEIDELLYNNNKKIYGVYTEEEQRIINNWNNVLGRDDALDFTVFKDADFLREFLNVIPLDEQFNYVLNTYNLYMGKPYNAEYAIVTRRAVPSDTPKPEAFWTIEHREVKTGLTNEMPNGSPQRLHSVIMVSTIGRLAKHGYAYTENGGSDGEIVIDPTKPFNDFLFMYKPENEIEELKKYLNNGGISREELLEEFRKTASNRLDAQGFKK